MAYLDWKELPIHLETTVRSRLKTEVSLKVRAKEAQELCSHLQEVYAGSVHELRMGLPRGWVVFWKKKEGGSRALLAHPSEHEWVATLALEAEFGQKLLFSLKNLEEG